MAQHSALLRTDLDVCPSCGEFAELDDVTGWCVECTANNAPLEPRRCVSCDRPFSYSRTTRYRYKCSGCQRRDFLEKHSERVAELRAQGHSIEKAMKIINEETLPRCMICNEPLRNATRGRAFFCRSKAICISARTRFKYLKEKGVPPDKALQETLAKFAP
jgi:hypothetical protein